MGSLTISRRMLDKYFGYLKNLDNKSKKELIAKLTKSLQVKPKNDFDPKDLFGAWEDNRDSDEIIKEIRSSRIEKQSTESLG